jgi:acylaminoacyl-peptidase|tara:strand:- start:313 stop:2415 length:2103 start_codon:yes stop_codon:yes gene_type:complete
LDDFKYPEGMKNNFIPNLINHASIVAVLSLCFLMFLTPQIIAEENKAFDPMDVFELEWASDPQVSSDGETIVYVRRSNDIMKDRVRSNLWRINTSGKNHRPLHSGFKNSYSPRWSPDNTKIAFVSNNSGSTQIHMHWVGSGETTVISQLQESPSSLSWSPDGKWLAFTMNVKGKSTSIVKSRTKPDGASWAKKPITVTTTRYQYDGRGIVEPSYRHVFVVPADGGTARQLTNGNFNHYGSLAWSADSKDIFFSAHRSDDWELISGESNLYKITVSNKKLEQITSMPGEERSPSISPNGEVIAFYVKERRPLAYTPSRIAVMNLKSGNMQIISNDLDDDSDNLFWSNDGESIYFAFDQRGKRTIKKISLSGKVSDFADNVGGTTIGRPYISGEFHAANDVIAYTFGQADRPADLAITVNKETNVVTSLNEDILGHRKLGKVNEITYRSSFDGQEIQGWYITPPDFNPKKKYPLILEIHGGPHLAYGPHFSAELQIMAASGYIVFYDNYRGSSSYGEDFALLLQYKYSSKEDFADHMSGIDALINKGIVDEKNLFIAGGSAGGIATAYAIGLTDRFNAAVSSKPVINWLSKPLTADSMVGQIYHQFPGPPWEHLEHYWERSPLSLVGNVTTPTMLITGEEDRRTPISETEQFYQALRLKGVDSAMIRIPNTSHGIASRPSNLITKVDHILAWFEMYTEEDIE